MVKCSFCEKDIPKGTGKMYVKTDGKIFYFCSNKCEKNMLKHRRKARNLKWTETARNEKKKTNKKK
jgi:large subunit ribosomal protein L24e